SSDLDPGGPYAFKQRFRRHSVVAVLVIVRHEAFIPPEQIHALPVDGIVEAIGEMAVRVCGRRAAGQHERRPGPRIKDHVQDGDYSPGRSFGKALRISKHVDVGRHHRAVSGGKGPFGAKAKRSGCGPHVPDLYGWTSSCPSRSGW